MTRIAAALAAVVLAVGVVAAVPVAGAAQSTPGTPGANESDVAPGERLGWVVGVQDAELAGDLERRVFGIEVSTADTGAARAAVVAAHVDRMEARLEEFEERKQAIDRARDDGTISAGAHDARMAVVATRQSNLASRLDAIETVASTLPPKLLEQEGIDGTTIRTLEEDASSLTGPDADGAAEWIAGPDAGTSLASDPVPATVVRRTDDGTGGNQSATEEPHDVPADTGSTSTEFGDEEADRR